MPSYASQESGVVLHRYSVVKADLMSNCTPSIPFNSSSVTVRLSEAKAGDTYTVCVMFQDDDCIAFNSTTLVGGLNMSDLYSLLLNTHLQI